MDMKEFKSQAIDTCVEAITSTSKNLVEVVATKLKALHDVAKAEGMNEPLKFSKAEAEKIAFNARVKFNKAKGVTFPKGIKYDHSKAGGFASFRARELELTKIVQNIQFYDDAKAACDELVEAGTFKQTGASELTRAMAAIGGGDTAAAWKKAVTDKAEKRADTAGDTKAKAITPEGFTDRLEALVEAALEKRIVLSEDGKSFMALPPEEAKPAPKTLIENMPSEPEVMDQDAIAKMMDTTFYQNASAPDQAGMMAAFVRR